MTRFIDRRPTAPLRRTLLRALGWVSAAVGVWLSLCVAGLLYLHIFRPLTTAVQIQRRVEAIVTWAPYTKRYTFVPLERIDTDLVHGVIAAEDGRFFQHGGIDWVEMGKAVREKVPRGRLRRGGSTITQQLVKNLFLTTYRLTARKLLEVPLALLAELLLSKRRILELYLNVIEWGPGVYGAEAAARYYYDVAAANLSRDQAARLAACLPSPRRRVPQRMDRYAGIILRRMQRMGW